MVPWRGLFCVFSPKRSMSGKTYKTKTITLPAEEDVESQFSMAESIETASKQLEDLRKPAALNPAAGLHSSAEITRMLLESISVKAKPVAEELVQTHPEIPELPPMPPMPPTTVNLQLLLHESASVMEDARLFYENFCQNVVQNLHVVMATKLKAMFVDAHVNLFINRKIGLPDTDMCQDMQTRMKESLRKPLNRAEQFTQRFDVPMYEAWLNSQINAAHNVLQQECKSQLRKAHQRESMHCLLVLSDQNNKHLLNKWSTFFDQFMDLVHRHVSDLVRASGVIVENFEKELASLQEVIHTLAISIPEPTQQFLSKVFAEEDHRFRVSVLNTVVPDMDSMMAQQPVITTSFGPTVLRTYLHQIHKTMNLSWPEELVVSLEPILVVFQDRFYTTMSSLLMLESKVKIGYITEYNTLNQSLMHANESIHEIRRDMTKSMATMIPSGATGAYTTLKGSWYQIMVLKGLLDRQSALLRMTDQMVALCRGAYVSERFRA